jgi:Arc/MetJ family transcription regulator
LVDVDDTVLAAAAAELGTTTKKDTVNAALAFVASRRQRTGDMMDRASLLFGGEDVDDPVVMREARR